MFYYSLYLFMIVLCHALIPVTVGQKIHENKHAATEIYELQEMLYQRIVKILNEDHDYSRSIDAKSPKQLGMHIKNIYPQAIYQGDTLSIPYKTKSIIELALLKYLISEKPGNPMPIINIQYNEATNTITMNQSYPISLYRAPHSNTVSEADIETVFRYIYKALLIGFPQQKIAMKGILDYRGYTKHEQQLISSNQWSALLDILQRDGSVFYYPSHINIQKENISIKGLLYVIARNESELYHFGEWTFTFSSEMKNQVAAIKLLFFPFIRQSQETSLFGDRK